MEKKTLVIRVELDEDKAKGLKDCLQAARVWEAWGPWGGTNDTEPYPPNSPSAITLSRNKTMYIQGEHINTGEIVDWESSVGYVQMYIEE